VTLRGAVRGAHLISEAAHWPGRQPTLSVRRLTKPDGSPGCTVVNAVEHTIDSQGEHVTQIDARAAYLAARTMRGLTPI
jgi:hypothetical protein